MPINTPPTLGLTAVDRRNAHAAGEASYVLVKELGTDFTAVYEPDEAGTIGLTNSLRSVASFTTVASVVYAQYLGRATGGRALNSVTFITSGTVSSGVTTTVGFGVTPTAPNFAALSLTVRGTPQLLDTTGAAGAKTNTTALNYRPATGEHVWVWSHHSTGTTQPTVWGIGGEIGQGALQTKTAQVTAPTVAGSPYVLTLPAAAVTVQAPYFFVR